MHHETEHPRRFAVSPSLPNKIRIGGPVRISPRSRPIAYARYRPKYRGTIVSDEPFRYGSHLADLAGRPYAQCAQSGVWVPSTAPSDENFKKANVNSTFDNVRYLSQFWKQTKPFLNLPYLGSYR
jgi:hypothetical protein